MRGILLRAFALFVPIAVGLTGAFGFAYIATQQEYRQSANDPQVQLAEDAAASLARDYTPANVVPRGTPPIDLRTSLGTWVTVYDATGKPLESSGVLDDAPPQLPLGLFDTASWTRLKTWQGSTGLETRVTWQPRSDVRQAVVLLQFDTPDGKGFVAAGRSLRTTEERIQHLTYNAALAWSATMIALYAAIVLSITLL